MITDIRIHMAILMYLIGCFSLMIYNAVVIYRKKNSSLAMLRNTDKWIADIYKQHNVKNSKHEKYLLKDLKRVENLIAFSNALNYFKQKYKTGLFDKYIHLLARSRVFHALAIIYGQKKNEERAYFAHFISQYPQLAKDTNGICTETINTMISYIDASDIYCRSNVLKALCRVGDIHGIVNILQLFSDKNNFIHHRQLAEDLFNFAGDKEVLALYLWGKYKMWNNNIMLGVITFITMFSDTFKDAFLPVLQNNSADTEIRLAIIRYYKKYSYKPAQSILVEYLNQAENYDFATEAASALSTYPGQSTVNALTSALQSENWHVQYNAASSLVSLGKYTESFINGLTNSDSNALQIVQYMLEHTSDEKDMNVSEVIV